MKQTVKQVLKQTEKQIAEAADLIATEINDWQTIQNFISRRIQGLVLTEEQNEKLTRYQYTYNQLLSGKYTEMEVVEQLVSGWSISQSQAIKDVRDSRELFTTTLNVNKIFEIKAQLERNLIMLNKAEAIGDMKAYAQLEKNRQKFVAMLPEDDSSLANEFIARTNILQYNPELIGITPDSDEEIRELIRDLKKKYGGSFSINGRSVQDAEIIDEK